MFLSKPQTIETLNAYFIPCFVDFVNTDPESRDWYLRLRARFYERRRDFNYRGGPQLWIISPEGEPVAGFHVEDVEAHAEKVEKVINQVVADMHHAPGAPLARYVPGVLENMEPDDIALHVSARFLLDGDLKSQEPRVVASLNYDVPPIPAPPPPSKLLFSIRVKSPIDDWCVLSHAQEESMLPPAGAKRGATYDIPADVVARLVRHMCPPTTNFDLAGAVLESSLRGSVSETGPETRVLLSGRYACEHQLWHGKDKNVAEANVTGYLTFTPSSRRLTAFGLVTDPGIYGDHKGLRVPFSATAELWTGYHGKVARRAPLPPHLPVSDPKSGEFPQQPGGPSDLQGKQFTPPPFKWPPLASPSIAP
ncbi:MAG: hypothetical protein EB084_19755 [Proteobacteria bacterium]|nr:hypothetical protein [Pseudomonadota bacterium]